MDKYEAIVKMMMTNPFRIIEAKKNIRAVHCVRHPTSREDEMTTNISSDNAGLTSHTRNESHIKRQVQVTQTLHSDLSAGDP